MQPSDDRSGTIETLLHEERRYPPSPEFVAQANISDPEVYRRAEEDPEGFWREAAKRRDRVKEPARVLGWDPPLAKGVAHGPLDARYNCGGAPLGERGDKPA